MTGNRVSSIFWIIILRNTIDHLKFMIANNPRYKMHDLQLSLEYSS